MMHHMKRSGSSLKNKLCTAIKSNNGFDYFGSKSSFSHLGVSDFSSSSTQKTAPISDFAKRAFREATGVAVPTRELVNRHIIAHYSPYQLAKINRLGSQISPFARSFASKASKPTGQVKSETRKDVSTVQDPFDAPTYNIPEKPVTFTEGASYSFIILIGLGLAAAAAYAVFKELIFQPKEYKIFGKALARIQNDGQVRVRIGSPVTGYGSESRNRAARQRIPNRVWTDEDGVEHVEVNFYVRGPHGAGKVYTEMFKDKADNQWKFTYLIVEIKSPSPAQLMLESYVPA